MLRSRKRQKRPEDVHTHLSVRIEAFEARIEAAVNPNVYAPQYAWDLDDEEPLYKFTTALTINGVSNYPDERAGDTYDLTVYGTDIRSRRLSGTLKDVQARDQRGSLQYRKYRGREIPVYNPPGGIGLLDKVRGEPRWTGWVYVSPQFVNDSLVLLGQGKKLFVALHERKSERTRWIQSLDIQTTDPAEE